MKVVEKPWGREIWWAVTPSYVGKIIEVRAGHSLSLQYHREKLESMYFRQGRGRLRVADEEKEIVPGLAVTIPPVPCTAYGRARTWRSWRCRRPRWKTW